MTGPAIPIFCTSTDKAFIECSANVLSIFILILLIPCKTITVNSFYQNRRLRHSWGHTASKGKGQNLNPGSPSVSEAKNLKFFYFTGCHTLSFFFIICIWPHAAACVYTVPLPLFIDLDPCYYILNITSSKKYSLPTWSSMLPSLLCIYFHSYNLLRFVTYFFTSFIRAFPFPTQIVNSMEGGTMPVGQTSHVFNIQRVSVT